MKTISKFKYLIIVATVILLIFLLSKSLAISFAQYQKYRSEIIALQQQDAALELNIIKSRYELFTTYDPLVKNFNKQREIQQKLQNIPSFIDFKGKQEIKNILEERLNLLEQKESLSEWFKSQNALLKNSLRYLPLLISQFGEAREGSNTSFRQQKLSQGQEWFYPLKNSLNDLLRNVLLYDATNNSNLVPTIKNQLVKIEQIRNNYSISEASFPINLVRSHTNLILAKKPEVETLTKQIASPLTQQQQNLLAIYDQYYKRAIRAGNIYRILTGIILLLILVLINYIFVNRIMQINPKLRNYKKIVQQIISKLTKINQNEVDIATMVALNFEQDDLNKLSAEIDMLAQKLQDKEQQLQEQKEQEMREKYFIKKEINSISKQEESFSFLIARLLLITKNRQKMLAPKIYQSLEEVVKENLEKSGSQLIEFQGEIDRIQIIFSYPPQIQLSKLVTAIKAVSRELIDQDLSEELNQQQNQDEIWSDAYFIASYDGLNSNLNEQFLINV